MFANGKMRLVESVPRMGRRRLKENNEGSEFKYVILDIL
jgi:hypothetical protein